MANGSIHSLIHNILAHSIAFRDNLLHDVYDTVRANLADYDTSMLDRGPPCVP